MPQLDKVTFLSQFFWLTFFYLGFYYIILKYFLPKISRILKLRKRKISLTEEGMTTMQQEKGKVENNYNSLISSGLAVSKNLFLTNFQRTQEWATNTIITANKSYFKTVNNHYIALLGEKTISQNLVAHQIAIEYPSKLIASLLLKKMKDIKTLTPVGLVGTHGTTKKGTKMKVNLEVDAKSSTSSKKGSKKK